MSLVIVYRVRGGRSEESHVGFWNFATTRFAMFFGENSGRDECSSVTCAAVLAKLGLL